MSSNVAEVDVEVVERDRGSLTVRARFDEKRTPASMAVIATLADAMEVDPVDLGPLYPTADPDALDLLVDARRSTDLRVTFPHDDHVITVSNSGVVTVTPEPDLAGAPSGNGAGR